MALIAYNSSYPMIPTVLAPLFSTLLSIHALLYHPTFPLQQMPRVVSAADMPITLTLPRLALTQAPPIRAAAAIVLDVRTAEVLYAQNHERQLFPASTTKMMTALIVLEEMELTATASISSQLVKDGSTMGLVPGERIAIRDLVAGLLISSANDAADQLAQLYPGGTEAFVRAMNTRAAELGLLHTHYTNPMGYSQPGHVTTVQDLAILTRAVMQHPEFAEYVRMQTHTVSSIDGVYRHTLRTTNELLGSYVGMQGVKTGWTEESGECLVAQATRDGQTLVSVVLNSPDRFAETRELLDWAFASYRIETRPLSAW